MNVQKVCRALCIAARNPSSIYSMELDDISFSRDHKLFSEWLSRPRSLTLRLWSSHGSQDPIIGNTKWGQQVTHLSFAAFGRPAWEGIDLQNLGHFGNLTKCEIGSVPRILLNGQIASYSTLKELTLRGDDRTDNMIDELRKFENVEHLSLHCRYNYNEDANCSHSDPISFKKLRKFSIKFCRILPDMFHRILIGSHPDTVSVEVSWMVDKCIFPPTDVAVQAIRAVDHLNIDVSGMCFMNSLHPLLHRAQREESPFLEQCGLTFHFGEHQREPVLLPPIITLFQCAKQSKLELIFRDSYLAPKYSFEQFVKEICNAPYGTFNEIAVSISVGILTSKMDDVYWCDDVLNTIETEECSTGDRQTVRSLVMKSIDKLEEWMRAWLVFDVERMKGIGLWKLVIEFKCNLNQDAAQWCLMDDADWDDEVKAKAVRVDNVLDDMAGEWIQQKAERWSDIDKRCIVKVNTEKLEYTVTLALKS